jgi:Mg-chelatase subunit ChlD
MVTRARIWFVIFMLIVYMVMFCENAAANSRDISGIDVFFIVDNSGSMKKNDPEGLRFDMIKYFIDTLDNGDKVGFVKFTTDAQVVFPLSTLDNETTREEIKSYVDIPASSGDTDVYAGLKKSFEEIIKNDSIDNTPVFILCTDGIIDPGPEYWDNKELQETYFKNLDQLVDQYQQRAWPIFVVFLNSEGQIQDQRLSKIAERTRGTFYNIENIEEMGTIFEDIFQRVQSFHEERNLVIHEEKKEVEDQEGAQKKDLEQPIGIIRVTQPASFLYRVMQRKNLDVMIEFYSFLDSNHVVELRSVGQPEIKVEPARVMLFPQKAINKKITIKFPRDIPVGNYNIAVFLDSLKENVKVNPERINISVEVTPYDAAVKFKSLLYFFVPVSLLIIGFLVMFFIKKINEKNRGKLKGVVYYSNNEGTIQKIDLSKYAKDRLLVSSNEAEKPDVLIKGEDIQFEIFSVVEHNRIPTKFTKSYKTSFFVKAGFGYLLLLFLLLPFLLFQPESNQIFIKKFLVMQ